MHLPAVTDAADLAARQDAFLAACRPYFAALRTLCQQLCTRRPGSWEDLYQATLLRAWEFWPPPHQTALGGWLYTVCRSKAYTWWRQGALHDLHRQPDGVRQALMRQAQQLAPPGLLPPSQGTDLARALYLATRQMDDAVLARWNTLPPAYQATLALWLFAGYTYGEIATAQGIPIGTVMSRLHRARQGLLGLPTVRVITGPVRRGRPSGRLGCATLTGQEAAIRAWLMEGLSQYAIARRLAVDPRSLNYFIHSRQLATGLTLRTAPRRTSSRRPAAPETAPPRLGPHLPRPRSMPPTGWIPPAAPAHPPA